jgi:hypothetical protein
VPTRQEGEAKPRLSRCHPYGSLFWVHRFLLLPSHEQKPPLKSSVFIFFCAEVYSSVEKSKQAHLMCPRTQKCVTISVACAQHR